MDSVLARLFEHASDVDGPLACTDHDHRPEGSELTTNNTDDAARVQTEQAQDDPGKNREEREEGPAEVKAQEELEQHQGDDAQSALPKCVAQDDAGLRGIQAVVDREPVAERNPHQEGAADEERLDRNGQEELVFEYGGANRRYAFEPHAGLVGRFESQGGQQDIGKGEENPYFAMMPAEHVRRLGYQGGSGVRIETVCGKALQP